MSTPPIKPRRKPSQSRAWMTSGAIQDAFVISLVENGYDRVSMREIANVAGVGLGTLYLYFPNKESIAAVTIRGYLRSLVRTLETALNDPAFRTLASRIDMLVATNAQDVHRRPEQWRALMALERRITEPAVYQELYRQFVAMIASAFAQAEDWPAGRDPYPAAFLAFSLLNSCSRDTLMVLDVLPDQTLWTQTVQAAVQAGVQRLLASTA